jgi:hypothetical protein
VVAPSVQQVQSSTVFPPLETALWLAAPLEASELVLCLPHAANELIDAAHSKRATICLSLFMNHISSLIIVS